MGHWRSIVNSLIAIVCFTFVGILVYLLWVNRFDPVLTDLVLKNFAVIIGLPFAFIGAFIVVALFRQSEETVEFRALGITFKGASGEIVLWVICFLSIAGAIGFLWNP